MYVIDAGSRTIGPGFPALIAVEVGLNHNGDPELAHRMVDSAADAGADAVKFQNYRTEDFLADKEITYEYVSSGKTVVETQYEMFKRYELPASVWRELKDHCEQRNVIFFSTPTGFDGLQQLVDLGAPLLKNGSDYLLHLPLIEAMARTGIPTVLSTGMATLDEVAAAVEAFRGAGGRDLVLLHCTSSYPTPPGEVHLRKIQTLADAFDCPIGLSDHTDGTIAALGAVALGACFIEKHFTLDKTLEGPDHRFSADAAELEELVRGVRTLEANLGHAEVGPTPSEEIGRRDYRLSCVAARDLEAGHRVDRDDIAFSRPGTGVPPGDLESLLGRTLKQSVTAGTPFREIDFDA